MSRSFLLVLPLLAACGSPQEPESAPTPVWDNFPFDGSRTWEFVNTDATVPYKLVAHSDGIPDEAFEGHNVYPVTYSTDCVTGDCEDELLRTIWWSSDIVDGVLIHAYEEGSWSPTYEPPLRLSPPDSTFDTPIETITDGFEWTSRLEAFEHCPVHMNTDWGPDCARFVVEDGDDEAWTNEGLTGTWWAIKGVGVVAFELEGETGRWQLSGFECEPTEDDEECVGVW